MSLVPGNATGNGSGSSLSQLNHVSPSTFSFDAAGSGQQIPPVCTPLFRPVLPSAAPSASPSAAPSAAPGLSGGMGSGQDMSMGHDYGKNFVSVQKYNNLKHQLFEKSTQLTYAEKLKKEAEQERDELRVEYIKVQQRARHYEVQFEQNLKPQFDAKQQEVAQQKEQIEALQLEVAQLRAQKEASGKEQQAGSKMPATRKRLNAEATDGPSKRRRSPPHILLSLQDRALITFPDAKKGQKPTGECFFNNCNDIHHWHECTRADNQIILARGKEAAARKAAGQN